MTLTVEHASFAYHSNEPLLRDADFSVSSGEILAVLGPNGAGKTTMLRCLLGFLPWSAGTARLDGEDMRTIPERTLRRRVSYVPQQKGTPLSLAARDMILIGATGRIGVFRTPGEKERAAVEEIAEKLGIARLLDKKCSEISGGEAQMVAIARALAAKPELLVLDEPESGLDFANRLVVLDTLKSLARDGLAVVFNTHYPENALGYADKSVLLKRDGTTVFGESAEVVTEDNIRDAFGVEALVRSFEHDGKTLCGVLPVRVMPGTRDASVQQRRQS